ncbi:MAG: YbaB/EbfC family nucleoid-associated protein [Kibdelosporangium sp.]
MTAWAERLASRIESIDAAAVDNRQRAESYRQLTDELKNVTATATSPDGTVTVVAGPGGAVRSITFSEAIHRVAPSTLSATVMHTITRAQAAAARTQAETVRRGLGSTELLDRVLAEDQLVFGDVPPRGPDPVRPDPVARPAPARRPSSGGAHARRDHDDFEDEFDIFRRDRR